MLQHSNPMMDIVDGNTIADDRIIDTTAQGKQTTQTHLSSGDARIEAVELGLKPTACAIEESMPAEKYNKQPIAKSHEGICHDSDEAAARGNEDGLQNSDGESLSAPKPRQNGTMVRSISVAFQANEIHSPCSPPEEDTGFRPVLDQPSVVISNFRSQERGTKNSDSITRMAYPNRKRERDEHLSDDSNDEPDDLDDADYMREGGQGARGNSAPSHRMKRARRPTVRLKPRPPRNKTEHLSADEAVQSKAVADHTSLTSLHDIETIPIRGFLTRQILLSRVIYSITFEEQAEQAEHSCSQESGGATSHCENKIRRQHSKQPPGKGLRAGETTRQTRFLSEDALSKDDQLLIELKEERRLTWKRIAEYFPGRSEGSLQVRYCTRLKGRKAGKSGRLGQSSNVRNESSYRATSCEAVEAASGKRKGTEGVSRHRYGPPRRRQTVDRYSPV